MNASCNSAEFLVAHRGDRYGGGENTLAGFQAAATTGARYAECDIQFTRDLVPVVLHDNWLKRLCHRPDVKVMQTPLAELRRICAPVFSLPTLEELMTWLAQAKNLTLFVELKPPVRRRLTDRAIARRISGLLPEKLLSRLVIISQSAGLLEACGKEIACPLGWVYESPAPPCCDVGYIFMPWQRANEIKQWQGRGMKVGLYTVNDAAHALALRQAGADFIETNHYARMVREIG